jgi:coenzyme Q-binding protein COQ10
MPSFRSSRITPYSPEQMFALVADVERYPEFVPLCEDLRIIRRHTDEQGREVLLAAMSVGYKAIRETFTSRVTLDPAHRAILVEYVDGPFKRLENRWEFKPAPGGCSVEFFISYEFRSMALSLLMGSVFDKAFRRFSAAFEERARNVYGRSAVAGI